MPYTNILKANSAALVVIDVQEKMLSAITSSPVDGIIRKVIQMIEAAKLLDIPILWTEQYPKGIGPTDTRVTERMPADAKALEKVTCSAWRDEPFKLALQRSLREQIIIVGLETHVCIQQTAMDLLNVDYVPFIPVDAVGSRFTHDMNASLERMRRAGVEISSAESLMFELIERCDHPKFKDFLKIVK